MREIRCVFTRKPLNGVPSETIRFYQDSPLSTFSIIHDFLVIFYSDKNDISVIDIKMFIDGSRVRPMIEDRLKGMIDQTLMQGDGSIPLTQLQVSILLNKVEGLRKSIPKNFGDPQKE